MQAVSSESFVLSSFFSLQTYTLNIQNHKSVVLYEYQTQSLTLGEEYRLSVCKQEAEDKEPNREERPMDSHQDNNTNQKCVNIAQCYRDENEDKLYTAIILGIIRFLVYI